MISYEDFLALGQDVSDKDFDQRAQATTPQDPAGIVYTSGTTGVPKGAVLTNDNITFIAQSVKGSTRIEEGDEVFLFLPLAHVFARTCVYATLLVGCPTTFTRSMETVVEDMQFTRPHWFASVPRIYEKVYSKVISGAEAKGGAALKIFKWACEVGGQVSDLKIAKKPIPVALGLKYALANKLVFSKIQAALGGRVRWCISGAAPLNQDIGRFFHAAGVLILEGIGMTEDTSFTNLNRYDNYRFGWVGQPGPGVEQKLGEDGEVMFRGRNVMKEYYKMPEETAATITEDGWLLSGDIGEIDNQNFLRITGRKKELIITAGGKNIAPAAQQAIPVLQCHACAAAVMILDRGHADDAVHFGQGPVEDRPVADQAAAIEAEAPKQGFTGQHDSAAGTAGGGLDAGQGEAGGRIVDGIVRHDYL